MFILCYYYYYHHYNIYIYIYLFLYVGFSCLAPSSNRVLRRLPKPNGMPTALNEGEVKPWMVAAAPTLYICTRQAYGVHHTRAFSHRSRCLSLQLLNKVIVVYFFLFQSFCLSIPQTQWSLVLQQSVFVCSCSS